MIQFLPFPSRMYNVVLVLFGLTYFWIAYFIEVWSDFIFYKIFLVYITNFD